MNKISFSARLDLLAELAEGKTAADIGTDHGFVPIYLLIARNFEKVILGDINEGPLRKARENLALHGIAPKAAELRLGGGLEILAPGEADSIIIAGMGGELIAQILEKDLSKSKSYKKLILQPRTKEAFLRSRLLADGFCITEEHLVREKERICQVLCARPQEAAEGWRKTAAPDESLEPFAEKKGRSAHRNGAEGQNISAAPSSKDELLKVGAELLPKDGLQKAGPSLSQEDNLQKAFDLEYPPLWFIKPENRSLAAELVNSEIARLSLLIKRLCQSSDAAMAEPKRKAAEYTAEMLKRKAKLLAEADDR